MKNKLKVGDIIEVHGWIMAKGLEGGCKYKIARIGQHAGKDVYWFSKPRGKKEIIGHYVSDIDMWIDPLNNNRIEITE